jgi:histidinol-phosphate aminotransferase
MSRLWYREESNGGEGINFLTGDLAVGSLVVASNFKGLSQHRICAIGDASNREGNPRFPGIDYHEVPIDDPDERLTAFLPGVVAFIDGVRRHGPVLLHCVARISRSPALALCYLHERCGLLLAAALEHVRARRVQANPHTLFLRAIQEYYRHRPAQEDRVGARRRP